MAQLQSEGATERVAPDGLKGSIGLVGVVVFAPPGGRTQTDPIGSPIASPLEVLGIDKGLKPIDRMAVKSLPVAGNDPGALCQQVRGQMWDPHPGENKKTAVVGEKMQVP
jgi:hypothetical protein